MWACIFWCITQLWVSHPQLSAQVLTTELPPPPTAATTAAQGTTHKTHYASLPDAPSTAAASAQDDPAQASTVQSSPAATAGQDQDQDIPLAQPEAQPPTGTPIAWEADEQTKKGNQYTLAGNVMLYYKDYVVHADRITYDTDTGNVDAEGHLLLTGGPDNEHISASHGTMNLTGQTARLYDVDGSIGLRNSGHRAVYASSNPFLITGRMVVKLGPENYEVYGGTMTSCRLPHPDWQLYAGKLLVKDGKARGYNSIFKLLGVPLVYLPYVTHPVDTNARQSGFMIPILGTSSTNGIILGEQYYWAINRSTDLTLGVDYYSLRGWAQNGSFRHVGKGQDFATARFSSLVDRGIVLPQVINGVTTRQLTNQGGQDILFSGRHDYSMHTRVAADVDYLSAYIYRLAFTENFNQAVSSDVSSSAYFIHQNHGFMGAVRFGRFQSFESTNNGDEIHILHLPSLDFEALEHAIGNTGLTWSFAAEAAGLKRTEPNFKTNGVVQRFDFSPRLAYHLSYGGFNLRPYIGARNTIYSRSQSATLDPILNVPVQRQASIDRKDVEAGVELRAPVMERDYDSAGLGRQLRHTIEPDFTYRYVNGISNFQNILRFDATDILSDTNEVEYGLTQRLFSRATGTHTCKDGEVPTQPGTTECAGRMSEWITWRVAQKYFFNPDFGGANISARRQVLDTTLDFSGVAFLHGPRDLSPVISRLRVRTTENVDLQWDLDYDTKAGRIAASNVLADVHRGSYFAGISHARLNAPGETVVAAAVPGGAQTSQVANYNQLRLLAGFGNPAKRGLSMAANAGLDLELGSLQYGAIQTSYNWDCCGLSVEYRKFQLGNTRNENVYRFNFTLAGIGTAGNLRRAERLF